MKVKRISRKWIRPHTPTPQNLRIYKISFLDKRQLPVNDGVVLFYKSKSNKDGCRSLEESLAKILVRFYLLAGRYMKKDHIVDCSDQGAEFIRAEAPDMELLGLVASTTEAEQLHDLFPDSYFRFQEAADDPLLSIQATHFACGGAAIAVSISHRVFDAGSLGTFVAAWSSAAANNDADKCVGPSAAIPSFHLLPSLLPYTMKRSYAAVDEKMVLKRFVFDKAAITALKSRLVGPRNSGARAVCAVVARAMIAVDRAKHGEHRHFRIFQPVSMRERTIPPLPENACGKLWLSSLTPRAAASEAEGVGLQQLVDLMGDAVRKCIGDHAGILSPDGDGRAVIAKYLENLDEAFQNPETNFIIFSDWSKFGFYEADFGWGKPVWTAIGHQKVVRSGCCVLMSSKDGDGIEAWVHLYQNDMRCFEQDERIKLYATTYVCGRSLL